MSEPADRANLALNISNFFALYWNELEREQGKNMAEFLSEDSVYQIPGARLEGRDKICAVSAQRAAAVATVGRHLLSNERFDFSRLESDQEVTVYGVMTFFGGLGTGMLPMQLPMALYDFEFGVRRGGKHGWLMTKTLYDTIFMRQDEEMKAYAGNHIKQS
ncbi:MAG: nuclear transport factor 2 family protein [Pseudoxanthomonas sp.]